MNAVATVTSKGQVTLPASVRRALSIETGDRLLFVPVEGRVVVERIPSFLDLAGTVPVPEEWSDAEWSDVREQARRERARA